MEGVEAPRKAGSRGSGARRLAPWWSGLRQAVGRPGLVLSVYLASALPALLWLLVLAPSLFEGLNRRPAASGVLEGEALAVWFELVLSGELHTRPAMLLLPLMALLAFVIQLAVAGGVVHSLLHSTAAPPATFWAAMGRYLVRFLRSLLVFSLALAAVLALPAAAIWLGGTVADSTGDGRWFYGLAALGLVVAYPFFAWIDLAYDLSRIAAVHHAHRSMLRGFLRGCAWVLRRPLRLLLLHLAFVLSLVIVQALYAAVRIPWTPNCVWTISLMLLLQQIVLFLRAGLQVAFWAALVQAYRRSGAPSLARPRSAPRPPRRKVPEDLRSGEHTPSQAIPTVS